jgi:hypothetical protein
MKMANSLGRNTSEHYLTYSKTCNKLVLSFIYKDGYLSQIYVGAEWINLDHNQDQDKNQCCGCCQYGNELQGSLKNGNALNNDYYFSKY